MQGGDELIRPDWPAPERVRACISTRVGGVSTGVYAGLNVGAHVGDLAADVERNRALLARSAGSPAQPRWLEQVHGTQVAELTGDEPSGPADAAFTRRASEVCVILTADCLPVLFADIEGTVVAAAHAGWRGLAAGILENTIAAMGVGPGQLLAWLGPAIGPEAYEVDEQVYAAFVEPDPGAAAAFRSVRPGHWLADLYALARRRLAAAGMRSVFGGGFCTYTDAERFYSYRRDGECGRMASLIWLEP